MLIELESITKQFGPHLALDDVTFSIGDGITGLLGPNGAGKTTLIKILLGLLQASSGAGTVLGHRIGVDALAIRAKIGYMPEDDCYLHGMSGVDTVAFSARLSGIYGIESVRRAHEILDFCGIEQERYRLVETYSTGMRQRLKFAQSIVHDPQLLILDEPTAGLDPEERRRQLNRIRILSEQHGKAIVVSTHILPDVQEISQRVVIIVGGKLEISESMAVLRKPKSPTIHVRLHSGQSGLCSQLDRAGRSYRVEVDGTVIIADADAALTRQVWSWARDEGCVIKSLSPGRNSLEAIFLEAVGAQKNG